jgi:hypothetical protein
MMNAIKLVTMMMVLVSTTISVFAQSAYTSGAAEDNAAAGYYSPYGGYGNGLYAYAPSRAYHTTAHHRR